MKIKDALKRFVASINKSVNPAVFSFFFAHDLPQMKEKEFPIAYRSWVFACINALAEDVGTMKLTLQKKQKDDWKDISDHECLQVLRDVNPFFSSYDLFFETSAWIDLDGNAFWYLARNGAGKIIEIWPLNPIHTYVVKSDKNYIGGYVFRNEKGKDVPLDVDEVIHFKTFNPKNKYRGMGTVEASSIAIDIDTFASQWQRNFFTNSAMPSGILQSEGELSQDQYDRVRANWDAKYTGVQNAHRLGIMEGGLTFKAINPTQRDMEFAQSRKDIRDEIMAYFRTPKTALGITEDVNRANAEASEYVFAKRRVKPRMEFITTKLIEFYLPLFNLNQDQYRLVYEDPVPQNVDQQYKNRASAIAGNYLTIDEARAEIGLEPLPNGLGDTVYMSTLMQPIEAVQEKPESHPTNNQNEEEITPKKSIVGNHPNRPNTKGAGGLGRLPFKAKSGKKIPIDLKTRRAYTNEKTLELHSTFSKLNDQLEIQVLKNLHGKKSIKKAGADELVKLVWQNYTDWVGLLFHATFDGMKAIMQDSGTQALAEVDVQTDFDLANPRASDWLNVHALEDTNAYSGTIKETITERILQGVNEGMSIDDISGSIGEFFAKESDWRALRLAHTEVINAYNGGLLEGYKQSDVVSGKEWLPDDQACDVCKDNEAAGVIGLDEEFPSGDDAPTAHPNCECSLQPVAAEDTGE